MSERTAIATSVVRNLCDRLEVIRAELPFEVATASDLATRLARVRASMVGAVGIADLAEATGALCDVVRDMGREADPAQAESGFAAALAGLADTVPATSSPAVILASDLGFTITACLEAAVLAEIAVAVASRSYADRREASAAASRLRSLAAVALEDIALRGGEGLWRAASEAVHHALDHLNKTALDLKPVVLVESLRSLPSTVLAWRLYGDPARAEELVERNGVSTALFMPTTLEAIAS